MTFGTITLGLVILITITLVSFKRFGHSPLSKIRGPKSSSFLLGNLLELFQHPVAEADFEWQRLYGDVVRFKTVFGGDQLLIADPKALHTILIASPYSFPKQSSLRVLARMLMGEGLFWAEGQDHRRQKKVITPGFGTPEMKAFLGIFKEHAMSMCVKWIDIIGRNTDQKAEFDVLPWLSRGTLDSIGQAAFDVHFKSIETDEHPLARSYHNALKDMFGSPSKQQVFIQAASKYLPRKLLEWLADHGSDPRLNRARRMKEIAKGVAKELVRERFQPLLASEGGRDIFSLLIKANMDAEAKNKLTEEELLSQICTILFAGHETTSKSLGWLLLELARHPKVQSKLRAEIRHMDGTIRARGDTEITIADFDEMPYMTAVIKEGLRYHPALPHAQRISAQDDVITLSRPITTEAGEEMNEITVPKGTQLVLSIAAYNRNKELWGEDAHEFNPDRWLGGVASEKKATQVGVYSNLMTFLGGARACVGWRFALIEIQAFLIEIICRFELEMTEQSEKVIRGQGVLMLPMIGTEGESRLPLAVSIAGREGHDA